MNSRGNGNGSHIGDHVALKIQELYKENKLDRRQALLKIDNRDETARAPFQFDPAAGVLHRAGCAAIPVGARTALYGVWRVSAKDKWRACPRCKPVAGKEEAREQGDVVDMLYGLLSIVSQFGSVLRERGREYRRGANGERIGSELESLYAGLGEKEKGMIDSVLTTFDQMTRKVRDLDASLHEGGERKANGKDRRNRGRGNMGAATGFGKEG